jgi:GDP/UDP-N,N'-diacetylbacillosamine 2-epimerase (hydrolysing)
MRATLGRLASRPDVDLGLYVTGMHLSSLYGKTIDEIASSGLHIARRIPACVDAGDRMEMSLGVADVLRGVAAGLAEDRPDVLLVLGDRGEMLAGALAALYAAVPVAHIHGGERSGTVDESIRHAISKLAHLHLVSTEGARRRLIAMGEREDMVVRCGAPGLDDLLEIDVGTRAALCAEADFDADRPVCLMVMHPVVQDAERAGEEIGTVLSAARAAADGGLQIMALRPNADAGSALSRAALDAAASHGLRVVTHLPRSVFAAWMAHCDVMIGNSSSGVIEAASFGAPVVNIGPRQNGRERNANVVDVPIVSAAIRAAIETALQHGRRIPANVYGDGRAGMRIAEAVATTPLGPEVLAKLNTY